MEKINRNLPTEELLRTTQRRNTSRTDKKLATEARNKAIADAIEMLEAVLNQAEASSGVVSMKLREEARAVLERYKEASTTGN